MNSYISCLLIASVLLMTPVSIANAGGGTVFGNIVESVVKAVDQTVNFIVDAHALIVDAVMIAVISVATWPIGALCGVGVDESCDAYNFMVDPFYGDLNCRDPITGTTQAVKTCGDSGSSINVGGPSSAISDLATLATSAASPTCTQISLSGVNPQGHNWAMLRDGVIVKELTSADTSYVDTGLTPHTNYSYVVRLPYPAESGWLTTDSAVVSAYTKCLPQCGFGVDTSSIAEFSSTNLRWKCINNDPAVDVGSCRITDSTGTLSQTVNALSGSLSVSPKTDTTYTLTCTNIDGPISVPQNISVFKPGIQEIKP